MPKFILFIAFLTCFSLRGQAQVKAFDKLEMLYDQAHYTIVLRKSNKLLDKPQYDYSLIPELYKSMSLFQLSQNEYWLKRHPSALEEAKDLLFLIKASSDGIKIFEAHIFEISALKRDLISWSEDLKRTGKRQAFENLQEIMNGLFENVPDIQSEGEIKVEEFAKTNTNPGTLSKQRKKVMDLALKQVGVPYLWAGNDPSGFDCSGFSSYVLKDVKSDLPRRAKDQYEASTKIKQKMVQQGDLVFFDNGSGISHVGVIISSKNEPLKMIHASSTKGIIITEIENSSYWNKRIFAFGTFIVD